MKRKRILSVSLAALFAVSSFSVVSAEGTTDEFAASIQADYEDPEMEYRPYARWWLAEGSHTDTTLWESIQELYDAGYGGVEFVTLDESMYLDDETYAWGSEEWVHDTKIIIEECQKLGMSVSMTSGTHWSTANLVSITPDEESASQELGYRVLNLEGDGESEEATSYRGYLPYCDLPSNVTKQTLVKVIAAKITETAEDSEDGTTKIDMDSMTDITELAYDDNENGIYGIDYQAKDNEDYALFIFYQYSTGESYSPAVSNSYTINYLSQEGTSALIDYWETNVLTDEVQALIDQIDECDLYMDSLELSTKGTNTKGQLWCMEMLEEFAGRRSYSVDTLLPFLIINGGWTMRMRKKMTVAALMLSMTINLAAYGTVAAETMSEGEATASEATANEAASSEATASEASAVTETSENEDTRPRAIITTDLECDDMNSLIHLCLFFNDVDVDGIVYTASQFHFSGDGEHTLSEINDNYLCEDEDAASLTEYRPVEIGWIESLWENEYAEVYEYLSQNDPNYPTPEYLTSVTKVGNIEFEGDVREDTEGSDLIKEAILDDDSRPLYIFSWGGFNSVARALLSIAEDYQDTDQWEEIYDKVVNKVVVSGISQDNTFDDYIRDLYPDLIIMNVSDGYCGYFTANTAQADYIEMFNSEWLTENIKFDHGALLEKYNLMGDGTYYEGEPDANQYGQTTTIDWGFIYMEFDQYDFLVEGDSGGFMALISVGLRGLESVETGACGTWGGRITYETANGAEVYVFSSATGTEEATEYTDYNVVTGAFSDGTKKYIATYQEEWAARADWCVSDYDSYNHAPIVSVTESDVSAAAGEYVELNAVISDPDGDTYTAYWTVDEYGSTYSGDSRNLQVWGPISESTSFTIPQDAQAGDRFIITLQVKDHADAPMTRYAQVIVTVEESAEEEAAE